MAAGPEVLFAYRPARFGPMTVALLFIMAFAAPIAVVDRALAGRLDEAGLALAPPALLLLFAFMAAPSRLVISGSQIEVSRARISRLLGRRRTFRLDEIENLYPTYYEDVGMRFSPFASAEGTARHAGLRIEARSGERVVVPFTPTVLNMRKHGTPPYHAALEAARTACAQARRPMVASPTLHSEEEVDAMLAKASKPLLPFPLTVGGIFAPALLIPALGAVMNRSFGPIGPVGLLLVALAGLSPLLAVFAYVNLKSGTRAELLHEVQKYREHLKDEAANGRERGE